MFLGHAPSARTVIGGFARHVRTRRATPAIALVLVAACRAMPEPIIVESHAVRVMNQTKGEWHDVEVWVNDHYRVTARTLAAGGVLVAPLDTFVAGFGQRFDRQRQPVRKVEVRAKDTQGAAVTRRWGAPPRQDGRQGG